MLVNYPPIDRLLGQLATTHQCDILMAVESGSRCWGFDSPDSDFDVRGITVHLNQDRYLSLFTRPHDVDISTTVTVGGEVIDVVLWDLGKALRLCWKSNPSLIDWLQSPLDYRPRDPRLTRVLEEDQGIWYDRFSHAMHFFSMARKNTREFLQGDQVRHKKYLYIMRPLLAARWLVREPAGWPPINFEDLAVDQPLSDEVRRGIGELLVRKRAGDELAVGPHIHALDAFIHEHLATLSDEIHRRLTPMPHSETKTALADKRFVELLGQYRH